MLSAPEFAIIKRIIGKYTIAYYALRIVDIKGAGIMRETIMQFINYIQNMRLADYLDIALVAFLIYKLLPLIRTPHIMRLARTMVALVLVAWLTDVLRLHTLNWLLSQVLAVGLLAFVVLFQPELRRMLDHLGSVRLRNLFGSSKPAQEMDTVIRQTVMACESMGKNKVGALIVFARENPLVEFQKTGTQIDAQVSDQLLRNIFFKNSPLHDGAVIIQNGRIAYAGCVMPLSHSPNISKSLGTRHHAAVGTSEVSDAVVVVVSEENGTISVAENGVLKRFLAPETLDRLLHMELCPEEHNVKKQSVRSKLQSKRAERSKEAKDDNEKD